MALVFNSFQAQHNRVLQRLFPLCEVEYDSGITKTHLLLKNNCVVMRKLNLTIVIHLKNSCIFCFGQTDFTAFYKLDLAQGLHKSFDVFSIASCINVNVVFPA